VVTWKGKKIADGGFLINLKRREDRLLDSLNELSKLKIEGVEIFEAIDSLDGLGYLSCAESHLRVLKKQVEKNLKKIIIFEDDFILDISEEIDSDFLISEFIDVINLIDFDLFYLGTTLMSLSKLKEKNIIIPNKTVQTTCYLIDIEFSKFVINNFNYKDSNSIMYNENIDTFYSILSSKEINWKIPEWFNDSDKFLKNNFKIFSFYPIMFNQRPSYSDIQNQFSTHFYTNRIRNNAFYPKNNDDEHT